MNLVVLIKSLHFLLNIFLGDKYILDQLSVDKSRGVPTEEVLGRKKLYGENIRRALKHRSIFIFFLFFSDIFLFSFD